MWIGQPATGGQGVGAGGVVVVQPPPGRAGGLAQRDHPAAAALAVADLGERLRPDHGRADLPVVARVLRPGGSHRQWLAGAVDDVDLYRVALHWGILSLLRSAQAASAQDSGGPPGIRWTGVSRSRVDGPGHVVVGEAIRPAAHDLVRAVE